ncbi:zinc transporter SLC39A7-like [Ylistrum balloti]|uniref:zinc transporter SLC39A7-like n=1 Tax=Ylistrum balloti TaxID=509963 RepID=UPI002905894C|nr:zinc transporter SLC39A7-like [Ylistrum balloti]
MGFIRKKKENRDPNRPLYNLLIRNFSSSEGSDESADEGSGDVKENTQHKDEGSKEQGVENSQNGQGQTAGDSHESEGHSHTHKSHGHDQGQGHRHGHGHGHSHGGEGCIIHDHDFEYFQKKVAENEQKLRNKKKKSFLTWKKQVKS